MLNPSAHQIKNENVENPVSFNSSFVQSQPSDQHPLDARAEAPQEAKNGKRDSDDISWDEFQIDKHRTEEDAHFTFSAVAQKNTGFRCVSMPIRPESSPKCSHPSVYNRRMKACSLAGDVNQVLRLFHEMKESGPLPNILCYNTVLNSLVTANRFKDVSSVLGDLFASKVIPNVSTYNILVKAYSCYSDQFESAYKTLEQMEKVGCSPDVTTYSTLITGLSRVGRIEEACNVLNWMLEVNCSPNVYTFTPILQGLCAKGRIKDAKRLIELMWMNGCPPNTVTYNILIGALCKNGDFDEVKIILDGSELKGWKPNAFSYNIYMNGLCKAGKVVEAYRLLDVMMAHRLFPTAVTLNILFDGFCKIGIWMDVLKLLFDMLKKGIVPNTRTYNIVIHSLCKAGMVGKAKCLIDGEGFKPDTVTYNTLIHGFYRVGDVPEARQLFERMSMNKISPNVFTYTIMINILCKEGKFLKATDLFEKKIFPDIAAYSALIDGLGKNGQLDKALHLLDRMLGQGLIPNIAIYDSLIRSFCREGFCCSRKISGVCHILDKMLVKG